MNPKLRDAWTALDQARIPAWREWKDRLHRLKDQGWPFDDALLHATHMLLKRLQPFYEAVTKAAPPPA